MAESKYSKIKLGTGAYNDRNVESEWIVGTAYGSGYTYNINDFVLYNSAIYQSLQNSNTGHLPTNPTYWAAYTLADGGYFFQVPAAGYPAGGSDVGMWYTSAGALFSTLNSPTSVALVDGQLTPADALTFPAGTFTSARLEYVLTRGSGSGRQRTGELTILNDGISTANYSHEFLELGSDVQVQWSVTVSGGLVHLQYVTDATEGVPLNLSYTIASWT